MCVCFHPGSWVRIPPEAAHFSKKLSQHVHCGLCIESVCSTQPVYILDKNGNTVDDKESSDDEHIGQR